MVSSRKATAGVPPATALVVGVGAARGLGAALCRRFAAEGLHVFACGRTAAKVAAVVQAITASGGRAEAAVGDATREEDVAAVFERAERSAPLEIVVYNAGLNRKGDFRTLAAAEFEEAWRIGCFGGFLVGREAARRLVPRGRGTVLFTGASASLRGRPGFAQFAAAKASACASASRTSRARGAATASSRWRPLRRPTGSSIASHARRGRMSWICGPSRSRSSARRRRSADRTTAFVRRRANDAPRGHSMT
jgi:NADP-dependent 3-hydroxy acid dehydrogenase YdfG